MIMFGVEPASADPRKVAAAAATTASTVMSSMVSLTNQIAKKAAS
jgi:hypothetical protein